MRIKYSKKLIIISMLLICGLIILAYYLVVYKSTQEDIAEIEQEITAMEDLITSRKTLEEKINNMNEAISKGDESGGRAYEYDMAKEELSYLSGLMSESLTYNIDFDEPVSSGDGFIRRAVSISFKMADYSKTVKVIDGILCCPYRTIINEASFTPVDADRSAGLRDRSLSGSCKVNALISMVFIESYGDNTDTKGVIFSN